jgi:uncharacterized protein (TIGR00255 family)
MSVRSMTGYARALHEAPGGEVEISLKSVNHRSLDLHFQMEALFDPFESALRAQLRSSLTRGHIDIRASFRRTPGSAAALRLNWPVVEAWMNAWKEASGRYGLPGDPDINALLRVNGVLEEVRGTESGEAFQAAVLAACAEAVAALNAVREKEGQQLAAELQKLNHGIAAVTSQMEQCRAAVSDHIRTRLETRLKELVGEGPIDSSRLAQEVAFLVDKSDIGEEITRLRIHSRQLQEILSAGGEVGKKLDFLLQEMNRETNTILSKTTGAGETGLQLTQLALGVKSDIEKIREQTLNLE